MIEGRLPGLNEVMVIEILRPVVAEDAREARAAKVCLILESHLVLDIELLRAVEADDAATK